MSDERIRVLGIRRRSFLKQGAAAALAAPVAVSFGLDGIAEARPQTVPKQTFGHPSASLYDAQVELTPMLDWILNALARGLVRRRLASSLAQKLLGALLDVADKNASSACMTLQAFVGEVQREKTQLPDGLACDLLARAKRTQQKLGCGLA
jgi:hypothetical protein